MEWPKHIVGSGERVTPLNGVENNILGHAQKGLLSYLGEGNR
jgi:hypothetical protein